MCKECGKEGHKPTTGEVVKKYNKKSRMGAIKKVMDKVKK